MREPRLIRDNGELFKPSGAAAFRFLDDDGAAFARLPASWKSMRVLVLKSRKGERGLPRKARKRGGKTKKPGLSDEQTPILIARDRHGDQLDAVL